MPRARHAVTCPKVPDWVRGDYLLSPQGSSRVARFPADTQTDWGDLQAKGKEEHQENTKLGAGELAPQLKAYTELDSQLPGQVAHNDL